MRGLRRLSSLDKLRMRISSISGVRAVSYTHLMCIRDRLYDKGPSLLNSSDVHQYFANFTVPGSRTSAFLHAELLKLEAAEQSHSLDPYRFEKRIGGQRTYMGCRCV